MPQRSAKETARWRVGLRGKTLAIAIIPLVLMICAAIVTIVNINRMSEATAWVKHTQAVISEAQGIVGAAVDMETGLRGYLLAGQDQFLEPYRAGEARVYAALTDLQNTVSDNPPQVARLQEAEQILRDWQAKVAAAAIAMRREIGDAPSMNDMADEIRRERGKTFFDAFRAEIAAFSDMERDLLTQRKAAEAANAGAVGPAIPEAGPDVDHTYNVMLRANEMLEAAVNMETGMRGFLLAGEDAFLEPYNEGGEVFDRVHADLVERVDDNPVQVERLGRIKAIIDEWRETVVAENLALRREVGNAANMDDMADFVSEGRGKVFFDAFRELLHDFTAIEQGLKERRSAEYASASALTRTAILSGTAGALIIGGFLALMIGNGVVRGIGDINRAMGELAQGNNDVDVKGHAREDEIGEMARALEVFRNSLASVKMDERRKAEEKAAEQNAVVDDLSAGLSKLAGGDLTSKIERAFPQEYEKLRKDFNQLVDRLHTAISDAINAAGGIQRGADEIGLATNDLSQRTADQAAALEQTTAAIEEISRTVSMTAQNARNVEDVTNEAHKVAKSNEALVADAVSAMDRIKKSSQDVVNIVTVMDDIAFQTNILALNAGVEAARAGSSGKGFAVVASEVRNLAQNSVAAATEIRNLILSSDTQIENGLELVNQTGNALKEIVERVEIISGSMSEIARGTSEQSTGLQEINAGIAELDRVTQQNANMVQQTTIVADSFKKDATSLDQQMRQFEIKETASPLELRRAS